MSGESLWLAEGDRACVPTKIDSAARMMPTINAIRALMNALTVVSSRVVDRDRGELAVAVRVVDVLPVVRQQDRAVLLRPGGVAPAEEVADGVAEEVVVPGGVEGPAAFEEVVDLGARREFHGGMKTS
mgnify:CR=1 FL=1